MSAIDLDTPPPLPGPRKTAKKSKEWAPALNPTQQLAFDSVAKFVLLYGEKGCRSGNSLIYTNDGLVRLIDLKPWIAEEGSFIPINQKVIAFDGQKLVEDKAVGFWVEPSYEAIKVELSNGAEITGSHRHPLWVCWQKRDGSHDFGYVKFSEMKTGLAQGTRYWTPFLGHPQWLGDSPTFAAGVQITKELAYTIGALVGDGSLNIFTGDGRSAGFSNIDEECLNEVKAGLGQIGCKLSGSAASKCDYNIIGNQKFFRRFIKDLNIGQLSYHKTIPSQIISGSKEIVRSFLQGLFDTDGTVEKNGLVSFCTTSIKLSKDVQDVLAAFGILCVRRPKKSASGKPTWTLSIMGKHAFNYGNLIGFKIARKQARIIKPKVSALCPNGFNHNHYGFPDPIRMVMKGVALGSRTGNRNRAWHDFHRHLHSFKSIPAPEKVDAFCNLYECHSKVAQFRTSNHWLEILSCEDVKCQLYDLNVKNNHSFLASGTINHNSGKTVGVAHACVRHAYENRDAFCMLIALTIRTGKEGIFHDLESLVLPAWRDGNKEPEYVNGEKNPRAGELLDEGMGLEYTASQQDPDTKDRVIWVRNMHNTWSKILLVSIPYAEAVDTRIRGPAPSFVGVEEITLASSDEYFKYPAAQLGRRRHITGPQQFYASCNPEGPSHWVYKTWWVDCIDDKTGKRDSDYAVFHVKATENIDRLPKGYIENLAKILKDPIERRRLINGEWVDRPSGQSIFKNYFMPNIHVIGDGLRNIGWKPLKGFPLIVGYDPGPANFSISMLQHVPTKEKNLWIVFDELNFVGQHTPYHVVVPRLLRRMDMWKDEIDAPVTWVHIGPDDAFSHMRHDGSFDASEIERLSKGRIKMRGTPQAGGSVAQRVTMLIGHLLEETIYFSATAPKTIDMMRMLASTKADPKKYDPDAGLKPMRSVYLHSFDSLTYPLFYYQLNSGSLPSSAARDIPARVYEAGVGLLG